MAEPYLHTVVVDCALIEFHCPLILQHNLFLILNLLSGNRIARQRRLVAGKVHLRLLEKVGIALQRAFGCLQRGFVGPGVNLNQRVALLHQLPFAIMHADHLPRNLADD